MTVVSHYSMDVESAGDDGWFLAECNCGWKAAGVYPAVEDACDALMEHAYAEGAAMAHSQLAEARVAWRGMVADLIAVKGHLDSPYPDDNRWTPWQRFVERGLRRMEAALEPNPAKRSDS